MNRPKLKFATGRRYDTKLLMDGVVKIPGFDIEFPERGVTPGLVFPEIVTNNPYDVGELAFSHYLIAKDIERPLVAIPAFPSRFFPHLGFSINRNAGIRTPADLVGKRIAAPDWGYNPAVWMRGILAHQYDVPTERIVWVESAATPLFPGLKYPRSRRYAIEQIEIPAQLAHNRPQSYGMAEALEQHRIDGNCFPSGGIAPSANTKKMFDEPHGEIRQYVRSTGVLPINTVITFKKELVEKYPDLPVLVQRALDTALEMYHAEMERGEETDHMGAPISLVKDIGAYPLRYGLKSNRAAIRMMVQYCYEQGLIRRLYEPEDLFLDVGS